MFFRKHATGFLRCRRESAVVSEEEREVIDRIDGLDYLGTGLSRHTFRLTRAVKDRDVVVKFSRSFNSCDSYYRRGTGQNRAERRLYEMLKSNRNRLESIQMQWIADVYETGKSQSQRKIGGVGNDCWLIMEYVEPLDIKFPRANEKVLQNISHSFENLFVSSGISPDIGFENIGVKQNFNSESIGKLDVRENLCLLDFGLPNWYKSNLCSPNRA